MMKLEPKPQNPNIDFKRSSFGMGWELLAVWLGFMVIDLLVRVPLIQQSVWQAVGARTAPRDWFMGNVVQVRNAMITRQHLSTINEVIMVGSSQLASGFDATILGEKLSPVSFRIHGIGGLDSTRLLFIQEQLCISSNDLVILYLSASDIGAREPLKINWMRPFASFKGASALLHLLGPHRVASNWREIGDLALSSFCELWRSRDYLRHALLNIAKPDKDAPSSYAQQKLQREADLADESRQKWTNSQRQELEKLQLLALEESLINLRIRGANILVLEGQMNPAFDSEHRLILQTNLHDFLEQHAKAIGYFFVSTDEQELCLATDEWKDEAHFNERGRRKLTGYLISYLDRFSELIPRAIP